MKIIYRITDIPSTNPSPILQENKFKLNQLCLRSFVGAFIKICPEMIFLCDHCDSRYDDLINEAVPWVTKIEHTDLGINGTMLRAYELAKDMDEYVLFQECDYIYQPDSGQLMYQAMTELDIVSPYDHPNFYRDKSLHNDICGIKLVGDHHFRSTERNTMTWGTHSGVIKKYYDIFTKYGYLDGDVWYELFTKNIILWVPIPGLATHMVVDNLAPSVNWEKIWKKYLL